MTRLDYSALAHLVEPLMSLDFDDRVTVAYILGLRVDCCPGCGCYVGSPDCHGVKMADRLQDAISELSGGECEGCSARGDEVDLEDDDE